MLSLTLSMLSFTVSRCRCIRICYSSFFISSTWRMGLDRISLYTWDTR